MGSKASGLDANKLCFSKIGDVVESSNAEEKVIIDFLRKRLAAAKKMLAKGDVKKGQLKIWSSSVNYEIKKIYGTEHEISQSLTPKSIPEGVDPYEELQFRSTLLVQYIDALEKAGENGLLGKGGGSRVFIGHGRSLLWRELKDFLNDRLSLPWDEFNREAVAGLTTFERISEMLDSASFAFLVMTAEDQHSNASAHARQNVVHEVGLFQGRLGPKKAIILLEEGCSEFSNVVGLSQVRFPKGHISAVFEEIRQVLEREGVIKT